MGDAVMKCLERDRKKAVKTYGEQRVLTCLSEKTDYKVLCAIYSELQFDMIKKSHTDEAKWLKNVIEKTILAKVMVENGYYLMGKRLWKLIVNKNIVNKSILVVYKIGTKW